MTKKPNNWLILASRLVSASQCAIFLLGAWTATARSEVVKSPSEKSQSLLSLGLNQLEDAPEQLENLKNFVSAGRKFDSEQECLGSLQMTVAGSRIIANALPFSSVTTYEDANGPSVHIRILFNGEKINFASYCNGVQQVVLPLAWDDGLERTEATTPSTLDSAIGLTLLLSDQGYFDEDTEAATAAALAEAAAAAASNTFTLAPQSSVEPTLDRKPRHRPDLRPEEASKPIDHCEIADGTIEDAETNAIADALSEAASSDDKSETDIQNTAPLTVAEANGMRQSVNSCWNIGSLSSAAQRVKLRLRVEMNKDSTPIGSSIQLICYNDGDENAALQAFESAKRAIVRGAHGCGGQPGYEFDPLTFEQWSTLTLIFDASGMRFDGSN